MGQAVADPSARARATRLGSILLGIVLLLTLSALPRQQASADDIEQRIAEFWKRVDALGPADVLTATDLGQWAANVIARDPGAGITVADFRASTAAMQGAFDRAGVGVPPGLPKDGVEQRIALFWQRIDALAATDLISAADLGQWALNVTDRDPSKRIRVDDFRTSTAGMQAGFDSARSRPGTTTPRPTPTPTPTADPGAGTIREGESITAECGSGELGNGVNYEGGHPTILGYNLRKTIGADGSAQIVATVRDFLDGSPRRAPLSWTLFEGLGGVLTVQGCTATFSGATTYGTASMITRIAATVAATPVVPSEGGPRIAGGLIAKIVVPNPGARAPRSACGAEWLQVSITGPFSTSTNWFWLRRAGSVLWWGPFANNGTFQVGPGTYEIAINFAGTAGITTDAVSIPSCGSQRYIRSNQG